MTTHQRTPATVLAEIAQVRRHLLDAPPHHSGDSAALRDRLVKLEAELAQLRSGGSERPTR